MSGQKPREIAAHILQQWRKSDEFIEILLERALTDARLFDNDRGLCQELVYGVIRWRAALDWLIARKTNSRTQKPTLQELLCLGLYQIFWLDRIPGHAAVHETVELAKHSGFGAQSGFVNAVLRGYLREFDSTKQALAELKQTQPHIGWSHPEWLLSRWQKRWGDDRTTRFLEWNNAPPKTFARVNTLKTDPDKLLTLWRDENVEYDFVSLDWFNENAVFILKSHPALMTLQSFQQGLFYVQDPSTLLAVHNLDPLPDETVMDLCAAPGGKTTYMAQLMRNKGRIVAVDVSSDRLKLVQENCARLGVSCVHVHSNVDSAVRNPEFDRILVDAPCSNTGVMRRRVDLRWRIQLNEIQRLQRTQLDLLRRAAPLLKRNGLLVYSTCSLEPEENADVIKEFLGEHSGFKLDCERELLPFADGVDGAFVARLRAS